MNGPTARGRPWRVRVYRKVEDSVEVLASSAQEAERLAAQLPMVLGVLTGATIPGDKPASSPLPQAVEETFNFDRD